MTNYAAFKKRISACANRHECDKLDISLDRLFTIGALTISEFQKLDIALIHKKETCFYYRKALEKTL